MSENPNPYEANLADRSTGDEPVRTTRQSVFWAEARRGAKIAFVLTIAAELILIVGVHAIDPDMRRSTFNDIEKTTIGEFAMFAFVMFGMLPLNVSLFGGFCMGVAKARRG